MHECHCLKYIYIFRVAQKREDAVSKEVTRKLSEADNRKMSRKEKDERSVKLSWLQADYQLITWCTNYVNMPKVYIDQNVY